MSRYLSGTVRGSTERKKIRLRPNWIVVIALVVSMIGAIGLAQSPASAQQAGNLIAIEQDGANLISSNWQSLAAGETDTYRFQYADNNEPVRIWMNTIPGRDVRFQVWTEQSFTQASDTDMQPLATGTPLESNIGVLFWEGSLETAETYIITVDSPTDQSLSYLLNIAGPGLAEPVVGTGAIVTTLPSIRANVRTGPSTDYSVIETVASGTPLTILGQDATSSWLRVQLTDGTEGWIARFLTNFTALAQTVETPPLAPPASIPAQPGVDTGIVVTALPTARVNVRTGPSTDFSVIRTVASGTSMTVLGQDTTGTWLRVQFSDGTLGWIARFLTNFTAAAPFVQTPPLAPPASVPAQPIENVDLGVNIRTGPSTSYSVIRTVPSETTLSVLGQDVTGTWLRVQLADGTIGWVARFLTRFTGTVETVAAPPLTQPPLAPPATIIETDDIDTNEVEPGVAALPGRAASLDNFPIDDALANSWRTLNGRESQWYVFQHPGDASVVQIWMDVEPNDAAGFSVFAEGDARAIMAGANPDDFSAIGRGTPNEAESGDLFWRGEFEEHGRYYVLVEHGGSGDVLYSIYGSGTGFSTP